MMRRSDRAHRWSARRRVALAALMALSATLSISAASGESDVDEGDRDDASRRMVEDVLARNIFSAERARPQPEPEAAEAPALEPEPEPANPDAALVLVGVVIRNGGGYVFVEDRDAGRVERISAPGAFAQGEITDVDVDGVRYRVDGTTSTISVQQSFAGEDVDRLAEGAQRDGSGAGAGGGGRRGQRDETGSADREAILERMRRARERERGE